RAAAVPRHLAVENDIVDREVRDGSGHVRKMLWKPIARVQLHVAAALVGEQSNAVELALEDPVAPCEALLSERGRHRFEPVGHRLITSGAIESQPMDFPLTQSRCDPGWRSRLC